jgi:hypothetical protein
MPRLPSLHRAPDGGEGDALKPAVRVYRDFVAYGQHLPSCQKGRVLIPQKGMRAAIRDTRCTCGFDAALDIAEAAAAPSPGAGTKPRSEP